MLGNKREKSKAKNTMLTFFQNVFIKKYVYSTEKEGRKKDGRF